LTLYIPAIDPDSVIWSGLPLSEKEALQLYDVDEVRTIPQVNQTLAASKSKKTVFAIAGQVPDDVTFLDFENKDFELLKPAIEECRVFKDEYEVALTRRANEVSTIAHTAVLKAVKHAKNERELEALFLQKSIANGSRNQAYHGIFAGGTSAATLHYLKNDAPLEGKLNLLLDGGAEYSCYASDIVSFTKVVVWSTY
jgi:Xaa-Pro dipeptidase